MPIRMEKDEPDKPRQPQDNQNNNQDHQNQDNRRDEQRERQRQPSGNPLMRLVPFLILFLFRNSKWFVPILFIMAAWYFFFGGDAFMAGDNSADPFSMGCSMDEKEFDKAEVFAPLAAGSFNRMPTSTSLLKYCPERKNQGRQGSCVGWSSAYAARTILHSRATGDDPDEMAFSPSYLYNQIALPGCQGSYIQYAMEAMKRRGLVPFKNFGYDPSTCSVAPRAEHHQLAQNYRIKGFNRLTLDGNNYKIDMAAIKQNLVQGAPVVIGMKVGQSFMQGMRGRDVWQPSRQDFSGRGLGGHAMCVIGYDDKKYGGSFQIMNSWGRQWGRDGIGWVRYPDFEGFVLEAYGLYPEGLAEEREVFNSTKLAVEFGLVDIESGEFIALRDKGNRVFQSQRPIAVGDKFKIAVANNIECNVYVFGQETDKSSYVLFPYTHKHSAYCGITGTRLFPKDYSMKADEIGNKDYMGVVVTKDPIDYQQLNARISQSRQPTYAGKLKEALGPTQIKNVDFAANETIGFICDTGGKNAVGIVIEIDKQ